MPVNERNYRLRRFYNGARACLSELTFAGEHLAFGLEDVRRPDGIKIDGETAIPSGTYRILFREKSGMLKRYIKRFGKEHESGMLHLQNVPNFEWVYIHCGNMHRHTKGCVLVAANLSVNKGICRIQDSYAPYFRIYKEMAEVIRAGEIVNLRIEDKFL